MERKTLKTANFILMNITDTGAYLDGDARVAGSHGKHMASSGTGSSRDHALGHRGGRGGRGTDKVKKELPALHHRSNPIPPLQIDARPITTVSAVLATV